MTQKQTTYSDDIKSAFEDKVSYKQAKKIAEDMKNLQGSFIPSTHFKAKLLKHLEGIHTFDEVSEVSPNFSLYRVFSVVFSFVFIFGVVYMIHDARQFSLRDDIKISEAEFQSNRETRANIEIIESLEQDFTSLSRENLVSENDLEQDKLQEPAATQETSEVQKANFIIQKDMKSPENTTFTDVPEETTQTFVNGEEGYDASVGEAQGVNEMEIAPMMMDMNIEESMNFQQICEQYNGIFITEDNICEFEGGIRCNEDNIISCVP